MSFLLLKAFGFYDLNLFKSFLAFITCLSGLKLKNFLKLVFKNEM